MASSAPAVSMRAPRAAWLALAILVFIDLALVVDREILVLLTQPIKAALDLTDLRFGLLQGFGIALFAVVMGYPLGWLADRYDRRLVLAGSIVIWGVCVVAAALAQNFETLFVAGAIGSAGFSALTPIAFALIPLLFIAPAARQLANSAFVVATQLGRGLVIGYCGFVVSNVESLRPFLPAAVADLDGWRLALLVAAAPTPLLLVLAMLLPNPRAGAPTADGDTPARPISLGPYLAANRPAIFLMFAASIALTIAFSPLGVWLPVAIMRQFGTTPAETGAAFGTVLIIGAVVGVAFASVGLPRLQARMGPDMPIIVLAVSCVIGVLTTLALLPATSARQIYIVLTVQIASMMAAQVIAPTMLQDLAPAALRGRFTALFGVVSVVGIAIGPPLVGAISDRLGGRADALLLASVVVAVTGLGVATLCFVLARKPFLDTIANARAIDAAGQQAEDRA